MAARTTEVEYRVEVKWRHGWEAELSCSDECIALRAAIKRHGELRGRIYSEVRVMRITTVRELVEEIS